MGLAFLIGSGSSAYICHSRIFGFYGLDTSSRMATFFFFPFKYALVVGWATMVSIDLLQFIGREMLKYNVTS